MWVIGRLAERSRAFRAGLLRRFEQNAVEMTIFLSRRSLFFELAEMAASLKVEHVR
jgi:hypothetical protein